MEPIDAGLRTDAASSVDSAAVGVFAWRGPGGAPRACAVTPYVVGRDAVVTSTLALLGKVRAVRRDPRTALLAGGVLLRGDAAVQLDRGGIVFDAELRAQELRKFPPSRALLSLPLHRRFLWWYVGRALLRLPLAVARAAAIDNACTLVGIDEDGYPQIHALPGLSSSGLDDAVAAPLSFAVEAAEGPALVLVHRENAQMTTLAQLTLHGQVKGGRFVEQARRGSLAMRTASTFAQVAELRRLAALARGNRALLDEWTAVARNDGPASGRQNGGNGRG